MYGNKPAAGRKEDTVEAEKLLEVMATRRSVRVYKSGQITDEQLQLMFEAARLAPSGANSQPWEFIVTRDRAKMRQVRRIYSNEWNQRKLEDPVHYKGLKKDYVGDVSALILACGDARTKRVYLTTRQPSDREKLFQANVANAVEHMMLVAAGMGFGTVWVSVRKEVEPELRALFKVPKALRLLWVVPVGRARTWPKAKPRREVADFVHWETYDTAKLREESRIRAWPKS
ncbi:MAG: nitroreductase family protein [Deltaproteobacteria bacterium]|nr:nitroreductase family protein [Deltaproteobacteria bacterium]